MPEEMIVNRNNDAFFPGHMTTCTDAIIDVTAESDILRAFHEWSDRINDSLMVRRYDELMMPRIEFEHRPLTTDLSHISVPVMFDMRQPLNSMLGPEVRGKTFLSGVATKMKYDDEKTKQDKNAKFLFITND